MCFRRGEEKPENPIVLSTYNYAKLQIGFDLRQVTEPCRNLAFFLGKVMKLYYIRILKLSSPDMQEVYDPQSGE